MGADLPNIMKLKVFPARRFLEGGRGEDDEPEWEGGMAERIFVVGRELDEPHGLAPLVAGEGNRRPVGGPLSVVPGLPINPVLVRPG